MIRLLKLNYQLFNDNSNKFYNITYECYSYGWHSKAVFVGTAENVGNICRKYLRMRKNGLLRSKKIQGWKSGRCQKYKNDWAVLVST